MTQRFIRMCDLYKIFAKDWDCDFSIQAMQEMFEFESFGKGNINISGFNTIGKRSNGYAVGKKWLNVQVSAWREEINASLTRRKYLLHELWADEKYKDHHEWLIDVLRLRSIVNQLESDIQKLVCK